MRLAFYGQEKEPVIFHKFFEVSEIVPPALTRGGHPGGVVSDCFALIENAEGQLLRVNPHKITFKDSSKVLASLEVL